MNNQQARLEAHLDGLRNRGIDGSSAVDLVTQTALAADGYVLSALDDDLND